MWEKIKNLVSSAFRGKLLLALGVDRYLPQIIFAFVWAIVFIWFNLQIDKTLHTKEENRKMLENLQCMYTDSVCKLTALNSVCEVEKMLKDMDSEVQIPKQKAIKIK